MLKRILAIILSVIMIFCISMTVYAEDTNTPPEMPTGDMTPPDWENGQPPEPPSGDMAPPDWGNGQPPEKPDGDGTPPGGGNGQPPEKPNGNGPGGMGGPGGAPGGQQGHVEGQLGSWSLGGTDANSEGGNDYAYDAALYVTAEGISQDQSSAERISAGVYDESSAENVVINDSESGHNGILVYNTDYIVSDAEITMLTEADGTDTCDFSGKGTAIAAFGSPRLPPSPR